MAPGSASQRREMFMVEKYRGTFPAGDKARFLIHVCALYTDAIVRKRESGCVLSFVKKFNSAVHDEL
jgi:hypothetical protein